MNDKEKKTDLGMLKINNDVIASIARNAAMEVEGVSGVKSGSLSLFSDFFNKGYRQRGITLEIGDNEVTLGVTIIVEYGVNIPDVAGKVQENIRNAVEEMTGLTVAEVNVSVGEIHSGQNFQE